MIRKINYLHLVVQTLWIFSVFFILSSYNFLLTLLWWIILTFTIFIFYKENKYFSALYLFFDNLIVWWRDIFILIWKKIFYLIREIINSIKNTNTWIWRFTNKENIIVYKKLIIKYFSFFNQKNRLSREMFLLFFIRFLFYCVGWLCLYVSTELTFLLFLIIILCLIHLVNISKRLHDLNMSSRNLLWCFTGVWFIIISILLIWKKWTNGINKYGDIPVRAAFWWLYTWVILQITLSVLTILFIVISIWWKALYIQQNEKKCSNFVPITQQTVLDLSANIAQWDTMETIRSKYPELSHLDDQVIKDFSANLASWEDYDTIISKYPELNPKTANDRCK